MNQHNDISWVDPACGTGALLIEAASHFPSYNQVELARFQASNMKTGSLPYSLKMELFSPWFLLNLLSQSENESLAQSISDWFDQPSSDVETIFYKELILASQSEKSAIELFDLDSKIELDKFDYLIRSIPFDAVTVDKISLSIPISQVQIADNHRLRIIRYKNDRRNKVLWNEGQNNEVRGAKAEWKSGGIYVKVGRLSKGFLEGNPIGCMVEFSLPGLHGHRDNSWPIDRRNAIGIANLIEAKLQEIGINVELRAAMVSRCELNRNIELDEPFENYKLVWDLVHHSRTKRTDYGQTGITSTNKSQGTLIYDKIAEMKKKGLSTKALPDYVARLEWEVMKASNVRSKIGIYSLGYLLDNWDSLSSLFLGYKKSIFCHDMSSLQAIQPRNDRQIYSPTQKQIKNILHWCRKNHIIVGKTAPQLHKLLCERGIEKFAEVIKAVPNIDRKYATTAVRKMRLAMIREAALTDPDFVRRYNEMQTKFEGGQPWNPFIEIKK